MRVLAAVCVLATGVLFADTVHLKGGGKVRGKVIKNDWVVRVRTPDGKVVEFDPTVVERIVFDKDPAEEYEERLAKLAADDAEGYYRLGLWCRRENMKKRAERCFRKAVELEPDHTGARLALGYVRHGSDWVPLEEAMTRRGLVKFRGRWVKPEERKAILFEESRREWRVKVKKLLRELHSPDPRDVNEAEKELRALKEEAALDWILEALKRERGARTRLILIATVSNYPIEKTGEALVKAALEDSSGDVRDAAVDVLRAKKCIWAYASFLKTLFYSSKERKRFAAMEALGRLKDKFSVEPLIAALVIKLRPARAEGGPSCFVGSVQRKVVGYREFVDPRGRKFRIPIIATSSSGVGMGQSVEQPSEEHNYEAYNALKEVTGRNFHFDQDEWIEWWNKNKHRFDRFMNPLPDEGEKGGKP